MIRVVIIAIAVVLVLGGVGAALSGAQDPDPGPAIVLDELPPGTAAPTHDKDSAGYGADRAQKHGRQKPVSVRSEGDPFTTVQPEPVRADQPDEPDQPDESDEPDEPDEPEEPDDD
jgi:hypothetical protein